MDNSAFYKYVENRGLSGYGAAILVKEAGRDKYSLLIASTSVPSVFGTQNSFEFDLLNSPVVGKIQGKETLDDKEVEFMLHRDNVFRLENLKNKVLDFMYMTPDLMGWHFVGKINYRPNDAGADTLMGTYTITPMSADKTPILDVSSLVEETLCYGVAIPDEVTSGDKISLGVVQTNATVTYEQYDVESDWSLGETGSTLASADGKYEITKAGGGLVAIKASATGYAPWITTIRVKASA